MQAQRTGSRNFYLECHSTVWLVRWRFTMLVTVNVTALVTLFVTLFIAMFVTWHVAALVTSHVTRLVVKSFRDAFAVLFVVVVVIAVVALRFALQFALKLHLQHGIVVLLRKQLLEQLLHVSSVSCLQHAKGATSGRKPAASRVLASRASGVP